MNGVECWMNGFKFWMMKGWICDEWMDFNDK